MTDASLTALLGGPDADARTFTVELLVPARGELPDGWTEERLDHRGASEVARAARDAGYTTNGAAARIREVVAVQVGDDYRPESEVTLPAPGGRVARLVTYEATGVRLDAAPAVPVQTEQTGPGRWEGRIAGTVVAPVVLDITHGLGSMDVVVVLLDADGVEIHPQAVVPVTASAVEVVGPPGTSRVVVLAAPPEDDDAG